MTEELSNSRQSLKSLFYPRSIALIGASERSPWSHLTHENLKRIRFEGDVFAVNKTGASAHGYPGYASCKDIPTVVDAAFLFVPLDAVFDAFEDLIAGGIRYVVILTSGFAEAGATGSALQERLVNRAREAGVVFLGPNCLGFANLITRAALTPTPIHLPILPSKISLVSQSGAANAEIVDMAGDMSVGLSIVIATGNEAMIDIASCVDFLVDDDNTKVIMVFAETIRDTTLFASAARRAARNKKAIVVLKVGTSELTAQVAAAHTGSLVGDDKVFDAACRELGVIRVQSIEDLVITSAVLAHTGPLAIPGVAIVSISGGACTLIADRAEFYGVSLPAFSATTKSLLTAALPSAIDPLNPFDITGVAIRDPALFETVLAAVGADPAIGFVGCVYSMPWNEKWERVPQIESIGRALKLLNKPSAMLNQTLRPLTRKSRDIIEETGVPAVFGGLEDVVRALGRVSLWTKQLESINLTSAKSVIQLSNEHPDSERATCAFLASFGVPVIKSKLVTAKEEAVAFAEMLNEPVAMKISSPDILHKTEVGGVVLNIAEPAAITAAYDQILTSVRSAAPAARIEGILMSPMRVGGLELLVGTVRDAQWGPVIAVGLGGVLVEVLADTELHLLPVTPLQVRGMLTRLRGAKLLFGFRGMPAVDLDRLTEVIACIGDAALTLGPELETLEVNPLWIRGSQIEALDGLAIWSSDKSIQH